MRLDKFLCETGAGTRSEVKQLLKKGLVTVNGNTEKSPDKKIDEKEDVVTLRGERLYFAAFHYYLLHKPAGVITATEDNEQETVMSLLKDVKDVSLAKLFPVGRLDKDTEGLLLITDDGDLAHRLLSPKKHVDKTYLVRLKTPIFDEDITKLEAGVDIGDETLTMPAKVKKIHGTEIELTIKEGRYHQVKRMLLSVGNEVVYLKRLSMGTLKLPADLEKGTYRPLLPEELEQLKKSGLL
ncbi:MAG: rRNA pseudouridine synthase [Lachnospiraceae bacterium]|nr:rRNA pseudouridine synthase [Lachnospiraceae bacterium]